MSRKPIPKSYTLTTVNGSQVNGEPVYVGGNLFNVQTLVDGGTLGIIEVSNDKANWIADTSTLGDALTQVTTRPLWARGATAADAGAPQDYHFKFAIFKETED